MDPKKTQMNWWPRQKKRIGAQLMCMLAVLNMLFSIYFMQDSGTRALFLEKL
ncbi:hypothetical protein T07_3667 [Trichinella nelsoni]|uniref:Uncharacterized protein n=1 Tax=Trichinella nelsoni TaxID=6336 RepID=A0A0V0RA59_9BILA|nr:hypothetical protein T07_3667 [Trichinella nelsoni]